MQGHFVHPFDDDRFIAGNGTAGLEILEDLPDVDAIIAPLGGGGLLAGIGAAVRALKPDVKIYAAEPETAAPLATSLARGEASYFDQWTASFVDGAGGRSVLPTMWPLLEDAGGRLDRRDARRGAPGDAADRRARARHRRRRRGVRGGGGAQRPRRPRQDRRGRLGRQHRSGAIRVAGRRVPLTLRRSGSLILGSSHPGSIDMERFALAAPLPGRIHRLHELALDLWWSWIPTARQVFRRLDYPLWRPSSHNPVRMLLTIDAARLAGGGGRIRSSSRCTTRRSPASTKRAPPRAPGGRDNGPALNGKVIAYFSAEFALHQSLPIYAGGLGVLAGDHCKEASDLGVPLVGVGFMYPQGYFHQRISNEGWQDERYERLNWTDAPIETAITRDGKPALTAVPLGDRTVLAAVWRVRVGRVRLFLLDTDLEENAPWDRELSARLYGGDRETRIQQEIILGIGGVRVLRSLGIEPAVWHLNEGHAAFVALQRIRDLVEHGASFDSGARRSAPQHRLHDAHAGAGRPRRVPVPPGRKAPGRLLGRDRPVPPALPRARRVRQRQRAALQHDGAGHAHRRPRQRRQRAARRGDARDVAADLAGPARRAGAGQVDHQRRARADVDRDADPRAVQSASRPRLARSARRSGVLGSPRRHSRRRDLGGAPARCAPSCSSSSASGCASGGRPSGSARCGWSPAARCSIPTR